MGQRLRRKTLGAAKNAAVLADRIRPPQPGIVILIYHRVGRRTDSRVDLPLWLFEEQISRIAAGPGAATVDDALSKLDSSPDPVPPVVVTFDDGTADFVDTALPVLVRYRIPVMLYVATDFIDSGHEFPGAGTPASWSALADAMTTGLVSIGSHSHSHLLMDRVDAHAAAVDLDRSIELIERHLEVRPRHFAYPKALPASALAEQEVRSRFQSAALAGTKPNRYGQTDPYRLNRSPVQTDDGLVFFERKLAGGMSFEDDIRRLVNRRRLANASH